MRLKPVRCVFLKDLCSNLLRLRVESVLDVTLSHDAEVPDDFDGRVPQHVVFTVVKRLTWCNHDGFSGVDTKRINVLHVAHLNKKNRSGLKQKIKSKMLEL